MTLPSNTLPTPEGVMVRSARPGDGSLIFRLIGELAAYERLEHQVDATAVAIESALFGPQPRVFCDVATCQGVDVGFALWFYNFSTFRGRHGIYLEDLFVRPEMRGLGVGKALLRGLAQRCRLEHLARLEWSVLDWNEPSIAFYKAQGAELLHDWTQCRLTGDALARLGAEA